MRSLVYGFLGLLSLGLTVATAHADGMKLYTPKVGDWVVLNLNAKHRLPVEASIPRITVDFEFERPNTLAINVAYEKNATVTSVDQEIALAKHVAKREAHDWQWHDATIKVNKSILGR